MLEQPRGDLAITGGYVHYSANLGLLWSDGIVIATSVIGLCTWHWKTAPTPRYMPRARPATCSYTRFDSAMSCLEVRLRHDQCQANGAYVAFEQSHRRL